MRIHVCFVVSSLINEGPVRVMLNIIKYLDYSRFRVSIITLKSEGENSIINDFRIFPIDIVSLGIESRITKLPLIFKKLKIIISTLDPDIVHSHCPRSLILTSFVRGRFRKVHTIHNYPGSVDRALYGFLKGSVTSFLIKRRLRKFDMRIACGENLKLQLMGNLGIDSCFVRNGIDFDLANTAIEDKAIIREKLGMRKEGRQVVFVGRLSKEKNPIELVKIFREDDFRAFNLNVIGAGPLLEQAKEISSSNVMFFGYRSNVREYLIASDIFISLSLTEGMPNAVLEAMSVGLPLVLSDIPAHREIHSCFGNKPGCILIKSGSSKEIYNALFELLNQRCSDIKESVQSVFAENFTAVTMSSHYADYYVDLVS